LAIYELAKLGWWLFWALETNLSFWRALASSAYLPADEPGPERTDGPLADGEAS
jgi:hypothetical protein